MDKQIEKYVNMLKTVVCDFENYFDADQTYVIKMMLEYQQADIYFCLKLINYMKHICLQDDCDDTGMLIINELTDVEIEILING
jgi:hypothetical protein